MFKSSSLKIKILVLSTDFYSFESTESSYHTANEFEDGRPIFTKVLEALSVLGIKII